MRDTPGLVLLRCCEAVGDAACQLCCMLFVAAERVLRSLLQLSEVGMQDSRRFRQSCVGGTALCL